MKKAIIAIIVILVLAGAGYGIWYGLNKNADTGSTSTSEIYAQSMAELLGYGSIGLSSRYAGVVETQDTVNITPDSSKTIKEVFVEVGDIVQIGTPLFEYDTEEMELDMEKYLLDLENLAATIESNNNKIAQLETEQKKASKDQQLEYTMSIQQLQSDNKQQEYNQKSKQLEIDRLQDSIDNSVVNSTLAGVVKTYNENPGYDQYTGEQEQFMTIMTIGDYRIKGTINEQNVWNLMVGQEVYVRSRVDESIVYNGVVTMVDTDNPISSTNMYGTSDGSQSTNYPFYVDLTDTADLILGQHVFIEPNLGQEEEQPEGINLNSYFIVMDDGEPYVWTADSDDKLEKRPVTLGIYDSELDSYEILDGLSESDYIVAPMEGISEGDPVIRLDSGSLTAE